MDKGEGIPGLSEPPQSGRGNPTLAIPQQGRLKLLDLFSGIGGFSLGLERTGGFETVAFCEINPFCRQVLAQHWPGVPIYDDVRELTAKRLAADGIAVDVVTGGFPCQDISLVGRMRGLTGDKSSLWVELARIVRETGARYVILENSPVLRSRGLDTILREFASLGLDAEWHCLPLNALGAPHRRDRVWVIAYPAGLGDRLQEGQVLTRRHISEHRSRWSSEPGVCRVADGLPDQSHRLGALGNAVAPAIPELIGSALLEAAA